MHADLIGHRAERLAGRGSAADDLERSLQAAADCPAAFLRLDVKGARATAAAIDAQHRAGAPLPALAGLAVSVKDLFDVAGQTTTAGSLVLKRAAPASADATVVARVRAAGGALIGRTHMTEFAFSGVGLNPHYATPANPAMAALDNTPRIAGGSSSGAAASVACGAARAALGSDTGGSIRIPAALQGLVGFKNTQSLTPCDGMLPLSTTLDTACAITRSVRDAVLLHEIIAARVVRLAGRPLAAQRFAVAETTMLDDVEPEVATAFERALAALSRGGARIERLQVSALAELGPLTTNGGFAAAESWAWHRPLLAEREADYDPRVAQRIKRGEAMSAADYLDLHRERAAWCERLAFALRGFDAVLCPTVPLLAPPIAALEADDDAFFRVNALLLRNPAVVNLFDGCAISLPCHAAGEAPVGLMLWAGRGADDALLDTALAVEAALMQPGAS